MLGRMFREVKGRDPVDITDYVQKLEQKNQVLIDVLQRGAPNDRKFWAKLKAALTGDSGWDEVVHIYAESGDYCLKLTVPDECFTK